MLRSYGRCQREHYTPNRSLLQLSKPVAVLVDMAVSKADDIAADQAVVAAELTEAEKTVEVLNMNPVDVASDQK